MRIISGATPGHMALGSVQAWNLAWLTHDFEHNARLPYEHFVRDVRATLDEMVTQTAGHTGRAPQQASVWALTMEPATVAAQKLAAAAQGGADWPLLQHYGPALAQTWLSRAQRACHNHPQALLHMADDPAPDTAAAQTLWSFLRQSWKRR